MMFELAEHTFDDIKHLYVNEPVVARKTYPHCDYRYFIHAPDQYNIQDYDERPIVMRGGWLAMQEVHRPYRRFAFLVIARYIRRYKLTIMSHKDLEELQDRVAELADRNGYKRKYYFNIEWNGFFSNRHEWITCWIHGQEFRFLTPAQFSVIKAILRQVKKTDKYLEKKTWQRLVQQVI